HHSEYRGADGDSQEFRRCSGCWPMPEFLRIPLRRRLLRHSGKVLNEINGSPPRHEGTKRSRIAARRLIAASAGSSSRPWRASVRSCPNRRSRRPPSLAIRAVPKLVALEPTLGRLTKQVTKQVTASARHPFLRVLVPLWWIEPFDRRASVTSALSVVCGCAALGGGTRNRRLLPFTASPRRAEARPTARDSRRQTALRSAVRRLAGPARRESAP